jgi:UDP-hydrolysing UDP-N-acetyl-D-glucosamine 2-epimerase
MTRRIAVVTGSRAEFGLLTPLIRLLSQDDAIDLKLIVCAAHLSEKFGRTRESILAAGFAIDAEVPMLSSDDSPSGIARAVGQGYLGFSETLEMLAPDLIVVLGDRFELLAVAGTALLLRIPIAHIHGGEITEGAVDDAIRHAVTKMSHLHFTATDEFSGRVIQMGEDPIRVFNVGAIGLDAIRELQPMTRPELRAEFGIQETLPLILVTMHPETLSLHPPVAQVKPLLHALGDLTGHAIVITYPNADFGGRQIIAEMEAFASSRSNVMTVSSLGQRGYLSVLREAYAVVGNSSSGIIEAPSFGVPTVNIGDRQKGRPRAASVIDCANEIDAIAHALKRAESADFRKLAASGKNPYGDGHTARRIADVLRTHSLDGLARKTFYALPTARAARLPSSG